MLWTVFMKFTINLTNAFCKQYKTTILLTKLNRCGIAILIGSSFGQSVYFSLRHKSGTKT